MIPTEPKDAPFTDPGEDLPMRNPPPREAGTTPPGAAPAPAEDEPIEEVLWRFVEENGWLAKPRPPLPPRPPEPKSIHQMTPEEVHESLPIHLRRQRPDSTYVVMGVISRMQQDLEYLTQGKRAATYPEVDESLGYALLAEGLAPRWLSAKDAVKWWRAGGSEVLRETDSGARDFSAGRTDSGHSVVGDPRPSIHLGNFNLSNNPRPTNDLFVKSGQPVQDDVTPIYSHSWQSTQENLKPSLLSMAAGTAPRKAPAAKGSPRPLPQGEQTIRNGVRYQNWGGDVDATQRIMEQYPALMKKFAGSTIPIAVVPDNVTQYPIRDPEGHPRNWPKGKTYKDVPAVFYDDRIVIVASRQVVGQSAIYRLLHEMGHALDFMTTSLAGLRSSRQNEFRAAYTADLARLKKIDKIHYFDNDKTSGWSETYASSFARMKTDRSILKKQLPNIFAYWIKRGW